ncbi:MAG: CHASE2 domain-containing protein [Crocosphaera sp.]|nr:CHASE2 domain-containing protein [Crocosphaera sp.]
MRRLFVNIGSKIQQFYQDWQAVLITCPTVTLITLTINHVGIFQILEWAAYDNFFRLRPPETISPRITIVTIDEADLTELNQWPLSDQTIAQAINIIKAENPRIIALDIYRDLVVEPGRDEIEAVFQTTPNLIGVEKVSGRPVAPPPILAEKGQVALADIVVDPDSKVRRALLSVRRKEGDIQLSLGTKAALQYLEKEGIELTSVPDTNGSTLKLGKAIIKPLRKNDGGYLRADDGGYQILLNYRGVKNVFSKIPLQDLLRNQFAPHLIRDRIVFIGSTAESLNDQFFTPYSSFFNPYPLRTGGVIIHANISSQILAAALEGRPLIKVMPETLEWLWILTWSLIGGMVSWHLVINRDSKFNIFVFLAFLLLSLVMPSLILMGVSYYAFLNGLWVILIAPGFALGVSVLAIPSYQNFALQKLASIDSLTTLHNRRYFDSHFAKLWEQHKEKKSPLSIILCDVDYFKLYNDHYGHPTGDKCLQKVSKGILQAVRKTDLAARFGGEEFIVVLPNSNPAATMQVAQRICEQIRSLKLEHTASQIGDYVTVSCGSASMVPDKSFSRKTLLEKADQALYRAKMEGRNRSYPTP